MLGVRQRQEGDWSESMGNGSILLVMLGFFMTYAALYFVDREARRGSARVMDAIDRLIHVIEMRDGRAG
jgi:hypothetical protein